MPLNLLKGVLSANAQRHTFLHGSGYSWRPGAVRPSEASFLDVRTLRAVPSCRKARGGAQARKGWGIGGNDKGGNDDEEELIHKSFVIYRPAFDTIRVKSVKSSSPQVQTKFQRLDETDLIARVHFDLQGLPLGPFRETVTVTTDAEKYSEIYVGIEGTVVGELLLEPNQFFMGFLQVDTPVRRSITLEKRGKVDLEILKVVKSLSIVQTKIVPVELGKTYQIEATCTPTASSPKSIRDVIEIHTNSKKQPILKVPLYGLLQKTTASAGQ